MAAAPKHRHTVRVRIEGRVQGVSFRYWTERVATELELTGWVRNRADGSVEAVFSGPADAVARMLERCKEGPRSAVVTSVRTEDETGAPPETFDILPTI